MEKALTEIIKFNEERDWDQFHSPENLAKSIAIEAGELLECFQWGPDYDHQKVCEELADVMNYCLLDERQTRGRRRNDHPAEA